jgi:hypothetical protein
MVDLYNYQVGLFKDQWLWVGIRIDVFVLVSYSYRIRVAFVGILCRRFSTIAQQPTVFDFLVN